MIRQLTQQTYLTLLFPGQTNNSKAFNNKKNITYFIKFELNETEHISNKTSVFVYFPQLPGVAFLKCVLKISIYLK